MIVLSFKKLGYECCKILVRCNIETFSLCQQNLGGTWFPVWTCATFCWMKCLLASLVGPSYHAAATAPVKSRLMDLSDLKIRYQLNALRSTISINEVREI